MIGVNIFIVLAVLFFGLLGVVIWYFNRRSKFRFHFRVWSKDLTSSRLVKARITVDKENKNMRNFTFGDNPSSLVMRDPAHWNNGRSERWVISDESGEYQYLSPASRPLVSSEVVTVDGKPVKSVKAIDDARYLQARLHPTNRMLALEQMRNNQKRYDDNKSTGAGFVFGAILLGIIVAVGIIYGMTTLVKHSDSINDNIHTMQETSGAMGSSLLDFAEIMQQTSANLGYIYGQLNNGTNITRTVGGFQP